MFRNDLDAINQLRRDAVNVREAHPSGIRKLQAYAAQLVWIMGKFPIDVTHFSFLLTCFYLGGLTQ
jgi:BRO1-like domain.